MVNRSPNPEPKPDPENQSSGQFQKKRIVKSTPKILNKSQRKITIAAAKKNTRTSPRRYKKSQKNLRKKTNSLATMAAIMILLIGASVTAVFAWASIELILNPDKVTWLNHILPAWFKSSLQNSERAQKLSEIKADLTKQGVLAGEILSLENQATETFVLPVFKQRTNCQSNCKDIVELRVYRHSQNLELESKSEKYYNLLTQLPVTGLEESFVLAPTVNTASENQGSSVTLPVSEIERFEDEIASSGNWFYLRGQRQQGSDAIAYGYVVHYYPQRNHLQLMLSWTSPSGELPKWQQITGSPAKELVIDQTVGLEPLLRVYQVKPVDYVLHPIGLEEISLQSSAIQDSAYQNALMLARSRLWTPAWQSLQLIQKQHKKKITATAQAQIDLIRLHSQLSLSQADITWASPSQQVLAYLIDGRWDKALRVFETSTQNAQEITTLLKADAGRLWTRVEAALQSNSNQLEVQAWGALILVVQHGQERANSFLAKQTKISQSSVAYIQNLVTQLDEEAILSKVTPSHPSRIIGSVQAIAKINPKNWLQFNPKIKLKFPDQQFWYQVEVTAFHDGENWLYNPFVDLNLPKTSPAKFFWEKLGLSSDPTIQFLVWQSNGEQQTITANIQGVQVQNKAIRLLATTNQQIPPADNQTQPTPLALTTAALEWVDTPGITLAQLHQQDEKRVISILSALWKSLQSSGQLPSGDIPTTAQILQKIGVWPVQEIDLTGNGKPETVVTISTQAIETLNQTPDNDQEESQILSRPRTLIFSDTGNLIYNDFSNNSEQFLTAIAKLSTMDSLGLLVENTNFYRLKRWSEQNQRFE